MINRKIRYINQGGCGVFAAALCGELLKRGYNAKIIALSAWKIGAHAKKQHKSFNSSLTYSRLKKKGVNVMPHNHYMVKLGNHLIDSRGAFELVRDGNDKFIEYGTDFCTYYVVGKISLPNMQYLNKDSEGWNSSFNRRSIGSVNKYIAQQIKKLYAAK